MAKVSKEALIVGGVGGALPGFLNLINVDASTMFAQIDGVVLAGYTVRTLCLVILGAFLVWINAETDRKRALQIGIMGPAMVVGYLNATDLKNSQIELEVTKAQLEQNRTSNEIQTTPVAPSASGGLFNFSIISSAHAGDNVSNPAPSKSMHKQRSNAQKFWYGLTGDDSNNWFVSVGRHASEAQAQAQAINLTEQGYQAIVRPADDGKAFVVVIGSYLTLEQARAIQQQALNNKLPGPVLLHKYN